MVHYINVFDHAMLLVEVLGNGSEHDESLLIQCTVHVHEEDSVKYLYLLLFLLHVGNCLGIICTLKLFCSSFHKKEAHLI